MCIRSGKEFFGAEITVEHDRKRVAQFVIAIGSSSLVTAEPAGAS